MYTRDDMSGRFYQPAKNEGRRDGALVMKVDRQYL
jgi:hypothetical protein